MKEPLKPSDLFQAKFKLLNYVQVTSLATIMSESQGLRARALAHSISSSRFSMSAAPGCCHFDPAFNETRRGTDLDVPEAVDASDTVTDAQHAAGLLQVGLGSGAKDSLLKNGGDLGRGRGSIAGG